MLLGEKGAMGVAIKANCGNVEEVIIQIISEGIVFFTVSVVVD